MSCPWNFLTAIIKMPCKRDNSKRKSDRCATVMSVKTVNSKMTTSSFSNGHRNEYQFDVCYGHAFSFFFLFFFFLSQTWTSAIQSSDLHNCPRIIKFFFRRFRSFFLPLVISSPSTATLTYTRIAPCDSVLLASCSILFSFHFLKLSSTKKTSMSSDCSKCEESCNLSIKSTWFNSTHSSSNKTRELHKNRTIKKMSSQKPKRKKNKFESAEWMMCARTIWA